MEKRQLWTRVLAIAGLVLMVLGALDPLEGSLVILGGAGMAVVGASIGGSRHRQLLLRAMMLILIGVALMFGLTAMGGIGGNTGRSMWWALVLLPYPAGWVMGIVGSVKRLLEFGVRVRCQRKKCQVINYVAYDHIAYAVVHERELHNYISHLAVVSNMAMCDSL